MATRLTVSTQCPTCGADLDFSEGSNAVQCRFCNSSLLVTGRKHVLSYSMAPKLNKHRAVARVLLAHKEQGRPCRVINPRLYFVPYYRLTGHDLRWERVVVARDHATAETRHALLSALSADVNRSWFHGGPSDGPASLFSFVSGVLNDFLSGTPATVEQRGVSEAAPDTTASARPRTVADLAVLMSTGADHAGPSANGDEEVAFRDCYVEKNFVATELSGPRLYSLGVRPNVLRLNLYHRQQLGALGSVVAATIPPAVALQRALMTATPQPLVFRGVLGRVLSLIYFPYWVVETERAGKRALTVVDAVSEAVLKLDAPATLSQVLEQAETLPGHAVGFRPLVCPNCGWNLPARPDDVIFVCSTCSRAWQIYRDLLYEVTYQIADVPSANGAAPPTYLPFWRMTVAAGDEAPRGLTVPAFRYRRLKVLKDLATALSTVAPAITPRTGPAPALHGCYYDQEDAVLLAKVAYIGLSRTPEAAAETCQERRFHVQDIMLTWLPFQRQGGSLLAPFTGQPLSPQLLL